MFLVWRRDLLVGNGVVVKTPGPCILWAQVVLWVFVSGKGVVHCCFYCILHRLDVLVPPDSFCVVDIFICRLIRFHMLYVGFDRTDVIAILSALNLQTIWNCRYGDRKVLDLSSYSVPCMMYNPILLYAQIISHLDPAAWDQRFRNKVDARKFCFVTTTSGPRVVTLVSRDNYCIHK